MMGKGASLTHWNGVLRLTKLHGSLTSMYCLNISIALAWSTVHSPVRSLRPT